MFSVFTIYHEMCGICRCSSYQSGPREGDGFVLMHLQAEVHHCSSVYQNAIIKEDVILFPFLKMPFLLADYLELARKISGKSCSLMIFVFDF